MIEEWKEIDGLNGKYSVSTCGNVRNNLSGHFFHLESYNGKYKRVTLQVDGRAKHFAVHRLVASAFIPNPYNYPCVNHRDECPENNNVDNLEWCTHAYNLNYGTRNLKISAASRPVKQITFEGFVVATYYSANFAAKMLNVDASTIYKCLRGQISYAYDYKWEYA